MNPREKPSFASEPFCSMPERQEHDIQTNAIFSFIMKNALYMFIALASVTAAVAQSASAKAPVTLSGVLRTGMMGIGGETTGTELKYKDQQGSQKTIEVEVPPQTTGAEFVKDGASVSITGEIVIHHYVERGDVSRIIASEIKPNKAAEQ